MSQLWGCEPEFEFGALLTARPLDHWTKSWPLIFTQHSPQVGLLHCTTGTDWRLYPGLYSTLPWIMITCLIVQQHSNLLSHKSAPSRKSWNKLHWLKWKKVRWGKIYRVGWLVLGMEAAFGNFARAKTWLPLSCHRIQTNRMFWIGINELSGNWTRNHITNGAHKQK